MIRVQLKILVDECMLRMTFVLGLVIDTMFHTGLKLFDIICYRDEMPHIEAN